MKHHKHREGTGYEFDLPITPMLDMTFQLLFFFVVNFNPGAAEGQIDLLLPPAGDYKAKDMATVDPKKPSDTEIELPSDIVVIVKTFDTGSSVGAINQIAIQDTLGETPIDSKDQLLRHLKTARERVGNKDDIKIIADARLKLAAVVEIMDVCLKAGFQRVGFGPPLEKPAPARD